MREPGASAISGGTATLTFVNDDRSLDVLVNGESKEAEVKIWNTPDPENGVVDLDDAVIVDTLMVEGAVSKGDIVEVTLVDPIKKLSEFIKRRLAPPYAPDSSADRPLPVSIGAVRQMLPLLLDSASPIFALHDRAVTGIGTVRDGGYPYDTGSTAPPYSLGPRGELTLELADPTYELTADISSSGVEYVPPSPVDLLDGDGNPFAGVENSMPDNWSQNGGSAGDIFLDGSGRMVFVQDTSIFSWAEHDNAEVVAGTTYLIKLRVDRISGPTTAAPGGKIYVTDQYNNLGAILSVLGDSQWNILTGSPGNSANGITLPHTFITYYTPTYAHRIHLAYLGNSIVNNGNQKNCIVSSVEVIEVPTVPYTEDDEAEPMKLGPILQELLEEQAGLSPDQWDRTLADQLDADVGTYDVSVGYAGVGIHAKGGEEVSIEAMIRASLDSYLADIYRAPDGTYKLWTLTNPEDATPVGTLTRDNFLAEPRIERHRAPSLTRRARGRRNWHPLTGNMSTDTIILTPEVRAKLRADYRIGVISGIPLSSFYKRDADKRAPKGFALDKRVDIQHSIDRANRYYSVDRYEVDAEVPWSLDWEIGDVYVVDYLDGKGQRPCMPEARQMEILEIYNIDPLRGTANILLVG